MFVLVNSGEVPCSQGLFAHRVVDDWRGRWLPREELGSLECEALFIRAELAVILISAVQNFLEVRSSHRAEHMAPTSHLWGL